jgi:hypothetical protein
MRHIFTFIVLCCYITTTAFADDSDDALGLLAEALKCPNQAHTRRFPTPKHGVATRLNEVVYVTHETNKSTGNVGVLKIESQVVEFSNKDGDDDYNGKKKRSYIAARFEQLAKPSIDIDYRGFRVVTLHCNRTAGRCISVRSANVSCDVSTEACSDDLPYQSEDNDEVGIEVCDLETAGYTKLAIDTLVSYNQPTTRNARP